MPIFYFLMRSDGGPDATWAAVHMGAAWYDDHQHLDAGRLLIALFAAQRLLGEVATEAGQVALAEEHLEAACARRRPRRPLRAGADAVRADAAA